MNKFDHFNNILKKLDSVLFNNSFITKKNTLDRQLIPKKLSNSSSTLKFNFLWALSFRNDLIKARMFFFVLIVLFFLKWIAFLG